MPDDALIGARYHDSVYDADFTVVSVRTNENLPEDHQIVVVLDYDTIDQEMEVSLETFKSAESIDVISVPDDAEPV